MAIADQCYPVNLVGRPDDVACAALYVASDEASFVNGVNLMVDGGVSIQSAEALVAPALRRGWRPGQLREVGNSPDASGGKE
jgi:NAD(P)-dependent dehydrogenase (short-subunit alcohol dehydrogenase family)